MSYEPSPKQALFLWRLISSVDPEGADCMVSKARPQLSPAERGELVREGFVSLEARPGRRGKYFSLTDRAWHWAGHAPDVKLMRSRSSVGAEALEGLLQRLLPFLAEQDLPLASLFAPRQANPGPAAAKPPKGRPGNGSLTAQIEAACLSLSGGVRQKRVRLSDLRSALSDIERAALDEALLRLQDEERLVLYRDDNTAALTDADHEAALSVGGAPRHLVYLEA